MGIANDRLKAIRESLGMTQETFAGEIGASVANVRKLEHGDNLPLSHALQINQKFGYSLDYIYGLTDNTHDAASDMLLYLNELFNIEFASGSCPFATLHMKNCVIDFLRGYTQAKQLLDNGTIPQAAFDPWLSKLKSDFDAAMESEQESTKYRLIQENKIKDLNIDWPGAIRYSTGAPLGG